MGAENPNSKGQAWFCTTGLPSDIVIEVDNMTFHLHKFPLMSKSKKLHQLITAKEQENIVTVTTNTADRINLESNDDEVVEQHRIHINLSDFFPGDSETFESAIKFCYGVKIDLSATNVAPLRCAAEVLEMTEEYSENNLVSKTDKFLSQSVLESVKDSIRTLKSCENLNPLAEDLGIVERCVDSIVDRASSTDPSLLGWHVNERISVSRVSNQILCNGIKIGSRGIRTTNSAVKESWFEDLVHLNLHSFNRLIVAMKVKDLKPEIVETCLTHYAQRYIPGISRANRKQKPSSFAILTEGEQKELMEMVITNLPLEKTSTRSLTSVKFLFGLLRTANILNASEDSRSALEKKTATVLERANLDDLLIPSYSYLNETLYDVSCVERILRYFLDSAESSAERAGEIEGNHDEKKSRSMIHVGKLIDGYLSEIASDANLKPDIFWELALLLPDHARVFDDGLYHAIDVFLKAHPWITEEERERITGMLDCQKLTLEACTHAAQNERLPLRSVVQVLFFEQLQLRQAIAGTLIHSDMLPLESARPSILGREDDADDNDDGVDIVVIDPHGQQVNSTWKEAVRENQVLRIDMDSMRTRVHQLERECSTMKKVIEKIDRAEPFEIHGWRNSLGSRFGCKFKTQVCDSQSTVANATKSRQHSHQQ